LRIVIDLQGAQTGSRDRGIGRYSLALTREIIRQRGDDDVLIALNGLFPDTIEPIRAALDGLLPQDRILVWDAIGPVVCTDSANDGRRSLAEGLREAFLVSLAPDIVLITSVMEGQGDEAIVTIGKHYEIPTAAILYDLIPLIHSYIYLAAPGPMAWYREKIAHVKRADLLLAISSSSAIEAINHLGFSKDRITNISTAGDDKFRPRPLTAEDHDGLKARFGISRPYVLYTSATDERKNHLRLISAYAALPEPVRRSHQLVLAGRLPPDHRAHFVEHAASAGLQPDDMVITSTVTDDELLTIYNGCELFVFPSWHEGFGLPALEAMQCGRAVIASNTSSLPEVIGLPDALFDPYDVEAIADAIARVLTDDAFRRRLEAHSKVQAKLFSWEKTAGLALDFIRAFVGRPDATSRRVPSDIVETWALSSLLDKLKTNEVPIAGSPAALAKIVGSNFPPANRRRQLLVDVSELFQKDAGTGIQRVVRSIVLEWLMLHPDEWAVEPVYATMDRDGYRYARSLKEHLFGLRGASSDEDWVEAFAGDVFIGLDLQHHIVERQLDTLRHMHRHGVAVTFVVYDLLPVLRPEFFPWEAEALHADWLRNVASFDGAICISRNVADELEAWLADDPQPRHRPFKIGWFHLGGDIENAPRTMGLPADARDLLDRMSGTATFLMIGTIEPRKGHIQSLDAFELLWERGAQVNLVVVGKTGWHMEAFTDRLRNHPEAGARLIWLEGASDEYLHAIYAAGTCLLAASEGEGFGLPLIEAARHGLPIIARDLPVFREVAGEHAWYFDDDSSPDAIVVAVEQWLIRRKANAHPTSGAIAWLTWKRSAAELLKRVLDGPAIENMSRPTALSASPLAGSERREGHVDAA